MKRVTVPMNDGIVLSALKVSMKNIGELLSSEMLSESDKYELSGIHFDHQQWIGIMSGKYKVMIEIEEDDLRKFSHNHNVDFPDNWNGVVIEDVVVRNEQEIYSIGNADNTDFVGDIFEYDFIKLLDLGVLKTDSYDDFTDGVANYIVRDNIFNIIIEKVKI
jgi:hypothetical protein